MRYIIYKTTDSTLLIKDRKTIEEIKSKTSPKVTSLFKKYAKSYGLPRLSQIFFRFKPIFLAFKSEEKMKPIINKIRKLANKYHKPMKEDYLNEITSKIKNGVKIDNKVLEKELGKVNVFRKIRLAYALNFRSTDADSIVYKVRNGKGYATSFSFVEKASAKRILKIILDSIVKDD